MKQKKGYNPHNKKNIDLDLMQKLYFEDKLDFRQIAKYFGFKSHTPIYNRFKALGLVVRDNTDLKTGFKHSEETKLKMSIANTGRKHSEETKIKMSLRFKGNKNPMYGKYGKDALNYKGTSKRKDGYLIVNKKYTSKLKHRVVWESEHGKIPLGFQIHHINGDKSDNSLENLMCLSASDHSKLHYNQMKIDKTTGRLKNN